MYYECKCILVTVVALSIHLHYILQRIYACSTMRNELFQLRLRAEEKQAFQEATALAGISLSASVRERLRTAGIWSLREAVDLRPLSPQFP